MGLLDDAIREHLDLKRRRGGDPAEIKRAEQEALGPVRRNREVDPDGEPGLLPGQLDSDDAREESAGHLSALAVDEPFGDEDVYEDDDPFLGEEEGPQFREGRSETSGGHNESPPTQVMRVTDLPAPDDATAEFDVAGALAAEAAEPTDGEDVLEETPEFLQDTPDHDRLWFEQRPPRDFDFDG